MHCAVPSRASEVWAKLPERTAAADQPGTSLLPPLVLPLLTRSASLMVLLLQDGAIDLELTSSVVALDPGLAFNALQLANLDRHGEGEPLWQFPLALVAAGREALLELVSRAARLDAQESGTGKERLPRLYCRAVVRASMAQFLSSELAQGQPKKSFLAGLLFEVAAVVKSTTPAAEPVSQAELLSTMCRCLPAAVVTAALGSPLANRHIAPDPVVAVARMADALLPVAANEPASAAKSEELAAQSLPIWNDLDLPQRCALLGCADKLGRWAVANLDRTDPWEFLAKLERRKVWE